jgi:hypothetical protein
MTARKVFSFATMMVLAQRRHSARVAAQETHALAPLQQPGREAAARQTLQKMNGTKRLLVLMYAA